MQWTSNTCVYVQIVRVSNNLNASTSDHHHQTTKQSPALSKVPNNMNLNLSDTHDFPQHDLYNKLFKLFRNPKTSIPPQWLYYVPHNRQIQIYQLVDERPERWNLHYINIYLLSLYDEQNWGIFSSGIFRNSLCIFVCS